MADRLALGLTLAPSPIDGKGCFATRTFLKARRSPSTPAFTGGIVAALERLSAELAAHFPRRSDDADELSNAVEFLD